MGDRDRAASFLLKPFARACKEFDLLQEGDRVAVAVSGGKDSRALLDLLLRYRQRVPFSYQVTAIHVVGTPAGLPDLAGILEPWFQELDVPYRMVPLEIGEEPLPMDCFRCSWNRRKALFLAADSLGCNKLALGHNADDAAVTGLLNLMFAGRLEVPGPRVSFFDGRIVLIRPLIYTPAKDLADYARVAGFSLPPPCPHGQDGNRQRVEAFLRSLGRYQGIVRTNIWRAASRPSPDTAPVPRE